jgi:hypothetical protein
MPCVRFDMPGGGVAIVKVGKPRAPKCKFCRKASTKLCDAVVAHTLGGQEMKCDAPICDEHATNRGGASNSCPRH